MPFYLLALYFNPLASFLGGMVYVTSELRRYNLELSYLRSTASFLKSVEDESFDEHASLTAQTSKNIKTAEIVGLAIKYALTTVGVVGLWRNGMFRAIVKV